MDEFKQEMFRNLVGFVESEDRQPSGLMGTKGELFLLPESIAPHHLHLDELRYFPRYLCDAVICSGFELADHYVYWGWTATVIEGGRMTRSQELDLALPSEYLRDIVNLVKLAWWPQCELNLMQDATGMKQTDSQPQWSHAHERWLRNRLPSSWDMRRIAITFGFSLLEGLVRERCGVLNRASELDTTDPQYSKYLPYETDAVSGKQVPYYDKIRLWMDDDANPSTCECLREINDYSEPQQPLPSYDELLPDIVDLDAMNLNSIDDREGFLHLLKDVRNWDLHGQRDAERIFGAVLTTLCCTVFWDSITTKEYESRRSDLIKEFERRNRMEWMGGPWSEEPFEAYYPLE